MADGMLAGKWLEFLGRRGLIGEALVIPMAAGVAVLLLCGCSAETSRQEAEVLRSQVDDLQARNVRREYLAVVNTVLTAGGTIDAPIVRHPVDRKRMAATVFSDRAKRERLNAIVHPHVRNLALGRIEDFEAERRALALMDHPGIARVLDAGETGEGRPYFVMQRVAGEPLADFISNFDHPDGVREDKFEIAHHGYQFLRSRCFQNSAEMTCTTCHDPHQVYRGEAAKQRCRLVACRRMRRCATGSSGTPG